MLNSKPNVNVEKLLETWREEVDERLDALLPSADIEPSPLHDAMRYACLAPGKRLRPALCMASAEAAGAPAGSVIDAACAVEMVHAFSLIHDDLPSIDNDALRRGRPTAHVKFGEALAILAGDALFALAFQTLAMAQSDPQRVNLSIRRLAESSGSSGLVGGEVLDVLSERSNGKMETVENIHLKKTAALMSASCAIGGVLAGASDAQIERLATFGRGIGLAFQITDDLLNETSTSEQLGKAAGSDRLKHKATYPGLCGIERSRTAALDAQSRGLKALNGAELRTATLEALASFAVQRDK